VLKNIIGLQESIKKQVIVGTASIIIAMVAVVIYLSFFVQKSGNEQLALFSDIVVAQGQKQAEQLGQSLDTKIESIVSILANNTSALVNNYDFEGLTQLINIVAKDQDISFIKFFNDKNIIAAQSTKSLAADYSTSKDIYPPTGGNSLLGRLEVGVTKSYISQKLSVAAEENKKSLDSTAESGRASSRSFLLTVALSGGVVILAIFIFLVFLSISFNKSSQTLIDSAQIVAALSKKLEDDNQKLSQRTTEQANFITENSATTEEVTASIKQTASNAQIAANIALTASTVAQDGTRLSKETEQAMASIIDSSKKIESFIKIVTEIAFQTNILALNAAIEASKAGDHGKGFAVVAIEIRDLAQKASTSAKQIKELIGVSLENINFGSEKVSTTNAKLSEIAKGIDEVAALMKEISDHTNSQYSSINQINSASANLEVSTHQNGQLVDELGKSSSQLLAESAKIESLVTRYLT